MIVRVSKHIFVKPNEYQKCIYVDHAGLDGRTFTLPREIFTTTSWLGEEVSRGHSTCRKRATQRSRGLTSKEGLNVNWFSIWEGIEVIL